MLFSVFAVKPVFADCETGIFGWGRSIPVGNYICPTSAELGYDDINGVPLDGNYLYKCTSSGYEQATGCNRNWGNSYCFNEGTNAYCGCDPRAFGLPNLIAWWGDWYKPVYYTTNYSQSAVVYLGRTYLCLYGGGGFRWYDDTGDSKWPMCINQKELEGLYFGVTEASPGDCRFLDHQSGDCVWSSTQKQCVPKAADPVCNLALAPNYCVGTFYPNNFGSYVCPGSKPVVNGGWSAWSACDATVGVCGAGTQTRTCTNPSPSCGGLQCLKLDGTRGLTETRACTASCPVGQNCQNGVCGTAVNGRCSSVSPYLCLGTITGTTAGSSRCVDKYGVCQKNVDGSQPATGAACTLNNGVAGTYEYGFCDITGTRCCVPNSGEGAATDNIWMCRGAFGGTNAYPCSCTVGTAGVCASPPDGSSLSTAPTGTLCSAGTASVVTTNATTYTWSCAGVAGTCGLGAGASDSCVATRDNPPVFSKILVKNLAGVLMLPDSSARNNICETNFTAQTARFEVTYTDTQLGTDIGSIRLQIGSDIFTDNNLDVAGTSATATFDIPIAWVTSRNLEDLMVSASDVNTYTGSVTTFINANGRKFKYWDCRVPVTGTGYDGSLNGESCPSDSSTPIAIDYALTMQYMSGSGDAADKIMTVNFPNYSGGSNSLYWGSDYKVYLPNFSGSQPTFSRINKAASCSGLQFTVSTFVSPYSSAIGITVDFSSVVAQDPWWRAEVGGVSSNNLISNRIPVTCATNCNISVGGFVSAKTISNTNQDTATVQPLFYEGNNAKLVDVNTNYYYFYNQYYVKNGVGIVLEGNKSIADIGSTGIYFVNGNLTIDQDKDVDILGNKFLMIIVNGDINVGAGVELIDGILVANNINATGTNDNQLVFNGSLYAFNNIDFSSRGHTDKVLNNSRPSVRVVQSPQLIFNIPGNLAKVLTKWQWGN